MANITIDFSKDDAETTTVHPDGASPPVTLETMCAEFARLHNRKQDCADALDAVKDAMKRLESRILDRFQEAGVDGLKVKTPDGPRTVSLRRDIRCIKRKGVETPDLVAALRKHGYEHLVQESYNANTMTSWLREEAVDEATGLPMIPDELQEVLEPLEIFSVRTTRR